MAEDAKMEVNNKYCVGVQGDSLTILLPPRLLSKSDALLLAAWLVTLAEQEEGEFQQVLEAVQSC